MKQLQPVIAYVYKNNILFVGRVIQKNDEFWLIPLSNLLSG